MGQRLTGCSSVRILTVRIADKNVFCVNSHGEKLIHMCLSRSFDCIHRVVC